MLATLDPKGLGPVSVQTFTSIRPYGEAAVGVRSAFWIEGKGGTNFIAGSSRLPARRWACGRALRWTGKQSQRLGRAHRNAESEYRPEKDFEAHTTNVFKPACPVCHPRTLAAASNGRKRRDDESPSPPAKDDACGRDSASVDARLRNGCSSFDRSRFRRNCFRQSPPPYPPSSPLLFTTR